MANLQQVYLGITGSAVHGFFTNGVLSFSLTSNAAQHALCLHRQGDKNALADYAAKLRFQLIPNPHQS